MNQFSGFVVAVNRTNGTVPGFEKVVGGRVYGDRREADEALEDACVLPGQNPDGSARVSTSYGVYEATVEVGRRLDLASRAPAGDGWAVLDIRADGYTIEAFDPAGEEGDAPDEVVTRMFDTSDIEWAEATARAEIGRIASARGWASHEVGLNVDRDLLVGGDPAPASPRP